MPGIVVILYTTQDMNMKKYFQRLKYEVEITLKEQGHTNVFFKHAIISANVCTLVADNFLYK
jgi:hypothetical protein